MLHHVSLEVRPEERERVSRIFELLGFSRVPAPEPIAGFVTWLEREGTQVHLIHTPEPTTPALGHCAIVAPDFENAVARLREEGYEVDEAQALWGEPRAFAVLPGGGRVEVMRRPPPNRAGSG
jgi:hypothetical protein